MPLTTPQKPSLGAVPLGDYYNFLLAAKKNLDMLTGRVGGELVPLPANPTMAQMITTINLIIARLNASTN